MIRWEKSQYGERGCLRVGPFTLEFLEEWTQFTKSGKETHSCNWWTFHPWLCELERNNLSSSYDLEIIVCGCGFLLRYWRRHQTEQSKEMKRRAEEIYCRLQNGEDL